MRLTTGLKQLDERVFLLRREGEAPEQFLARVASRRWPQPRPLLMEVQAALRETGRSHA